MRRFMQPAVLWRGTATGLLLTLAVSPYVWEHSLATPLLGIMRLGFLVPVTIWLAQAGLAWSPLDAKCQPTTVPQQPWRFWPWLVGIGVVIAVARLLAVDPFLEKIRPGTICGNWHDWLVQLPWVSLFQPLVLVIGVHAFALRFKAPPHVALLLIVVVRVLAMANSWHELRIEFLGPLLVAAGIGAWYQGWAWRRGGAIGLASAALLVELRQLCYLN